ncbi:MAG: hypothetical protein KF822_02735 [Steroidobacteraceae bacterium]|nr:hypothetical protein [Steroidobacteraceae bacterium]
MIALAIAAITTSIAVSSYRGYVLRSHRLEAVVALLAAAAEEEKFHLAHGRYSDRLGAAADGEPPGLPVAAATPQGRYRLAVAFADAAAFRIVADATDEHGDPLCRTLSIDEVGRREARDRDGRDTTARCW